MRLLRYSFYSFLFAIAMLSNAKSYAKSLQVDDRMIVNDTIHEITWLSWKEMIAAQQVEKKKVFIDVYTQWCGWCKQMDKTTFRDSTLVHHLNEHFYAVKLDAETKEAFEFNDYHFRFIETGRRGVNELAYSLLDGKLSYPSMVYLNENFERILISPGYKNHENMLLEMEYVIDEIYNKMTWKEYRSH